MPLWNTQSVLNIGCVTAYKDNKEDRPRRAIDVWHLFVPWQEVDKCHFIHPPGPSGVFSTSLSCTNLRTENTASWAWGFSQGFIDWYGLRQKYPIKATMPHSCCRSKDHDLHAATQTFRGFVSETGFGLCKSAIGNLECWNFNSPLCQVRQPQWQCLLSRC